MLLLDGACGLSVCHGGVQWADARTVKLSQADRSCNRWAARLCRYVDFDYARRSECSSGWLSNMRYPLEGIGVATHEPGRLQNSRFLYHGQIRDPHESPSISYGQQKQDERRSEADEGLQNTC